MNSARSKREKNRTIVFVTPNTPTVDTVGQARVTTAQTHKDTLLQSVGFF